VRNKLNSFFISGGSWFNDWRAIFHRYWGAFLCVRDNHHALKVLVGLKEDTNMNVAEKKELITRVKGMSEEEIRVVLDHIPVDLCLDRVAGELERLYTLESSLVGLVKRD
jgi:hypothetical protein